jgi:hypothetical protein
MNDLMETTMATAKRNCDKTDTEQETGTPNPYEKKAPRSILKGKVRKEKDEKTMMNEEEEVSDDDIAMPPAIKRDKGLVNDVKTNLISKFEQINASEESTAKIQKNESGNEEAKKINEEGEEGEDNKEGKKDTVEEVGFFNEDEKEGADDNEATKNDGRDQIDKQDNKAKNINNSEEGKETDGNKKEKDTGGVEEEKYEQNEDDKEEGKDEQKENDNKAGGEDKMNDENEDKDKMDEDKYVLDLQGNKFKKHAAMWKAIPEAVMNQSKVFTPEDYEHIIDLLENIATDMDMDLDTMDRSKWIKVFIKTKDLSAGRNKKRYIRIFGITLPSSNPAKMSHKTVFDGNKSLETANATVWAAAYYLCGPG